MTSLPLVVVYLAGFVSAAAGARGCDSDQDLVITGILDGPLCGGGPKLIEVYAAKNITDLSIYALSANRKKPSKRASILSGSAVENSYIYITKMRYGSDRTYAFFQTNLTNKFPSRSSGSPANFKGKESIELYKRDGKKWTLIDVFGEKTSKKGGNATSWEYKKGWAYRRSRTCSNTTFNIQNWSFSGKNKLDGVSNNTDAGLYKFPLASYVPIIPCPGTGQGAKCCFWNDPHVMSWDGQRYEFHEIGGPHPIAVFDNEVPFCGVDVPAFSVLGNNFYQCGGARACIGDIIFRVNDIVHTYYNAEHKVNVFTSGSCIMLKADFGLEISHCGRKVCLRMLPCLAECTVEQVCGMCGMHNFVYGDDYSDTNVCEIPSEPDDPYCPPAELAKAEEACSVIVDADKAFAGCHNLTDINTYREECLIDLCWGDNTLGCVTLNLLNDKCIAAGYAVGDWYTALGCTRMCSEPGAIWYPPNQDCQVVCQCTDTGEESCRNAPANWCPANATCMESNEGDGQVACFFDSESQGDQARRRRRQTTQDEWISCNNRLYPRFEEDGQTVRTEGCCYKYAYLEADFLCCRDGPYYLLFTRRVNRTEVSNQCCGSVPYLQETNDCCDGVVSPAYTCSTPPVASSTPVSSTAITSTPVASTTGTSTPVGASTTGNVNCGYTVATDLIPTVARTGTNPICYYSYCQLSTGETATFQMQDFCDGPTGADRDQFTITDNDGVNTVAGPTAYVEDPVQLSCTLGVLTVTVTDNAPAGHPDDSVTVTNAIKFSACA